MNESKKISIVIATYNGEKYLREQLDSLYSQTRKPDEIVVVDDRSTDGTREILEEYAAKKKLKYIVNKENLGVSRNFEKAVLYSTGDYIAICDQDDVWMPEKIQILSDKLAEIEGNKPACVSSRSIAVDENLNRFDNSLFSASDTYCLKDNLYGAKIAQGCTMMFNRRLVEIMAPFPKSRFVYDAYIGLLAACAGKKYNLVKPLMYYRHHQNNVVAKDIKKKIDIVRVVEHLRMWKHSPLFEHGRYNILRFIYEKNYNDLSEEAKLMIKQLLQFEASNTFHKIRYIAKEKHFASKFKVKAIARLLCTALLPLSSKDQEF